MEKITERDSHRNEGQEVGATTTPRREKGRRVAPPPWVCGGLTLSLIKPWLDGRTRLMRNSVFKDEIDGSETSRMKLMAGSNIGDRNDSLLYFSKLYNTKLIVKQLGKIMDTIEFGKILREPRVTMTLPSQPLDGERDADLTRHIRLRCGCYGDPGSL
ncbi:hypothetical protein CRG98_037915 [Punica granatum]|uniref:Uncharacterized protein n=1 Tax=Punica granatum TaxID=22663 RepID=A0A2I0ID22_PUNGR|nr:hypothetical protein CRG98_037915 [Punica granatum]